MDLPAQLRADLLDARKRRDAPAVTALRTTLAAIENAEAPAAPDGPAWDPGRPTAEHARLELDAADHQRILRAELDGRRQAIAEYDSLGRSDAAADLRAEVAVLERYLP